MSTEMETLRIERIQTFKDAIQGRQPKWTPHFGQLWSWKIFAAGYSFSDALYDYDIMEKVMRHTFENFKVDVVYETGWRNPVQVTEALGNDAYIINDKTYSISIDDQLYMEPEEYDALIDNPQKFLWETFMPRKYKYLQEKSNAPAFRNFLGKYGEFGQFLGKITQIKTEEYGLPNFDDMGAGVDYWGNGYEILFCVLRGIKGLSRDLRRMPDKVLAAIEALDETFAIPRLERAMQQPKGTNPETCVDINPVLLGHTILSPKQFEKFYWPHFERMNRYLIEQDKLAYIFVEGESQRFYEFFQQFPKDRVALQAEQNDIFEMKKQLPNVTVAGGMGCELLGRGTPEACVDYAKKLIDELAYDGKYIFTENKMLSFPNDCNADNLKAVCDFVSNYKRR